MFGRATIRLGIGPHSSFPLIFPYLSTSLPTLSVEKLFNSAEVPLPFTSLPLFPLTLILLQEAIFVQISSMLLSPLVPVS